MNQYRYSASSFEYPEDLALQSRVRAMLRHIKMGRSDKAATMARDAAHVIHGIWRKGLKTMVTSTGNPTIVDPNKRS